MTVNNSDAMLPCMMMGNLSGTARLTQQLDIASFPGLLCDQFLIIRSVQKLEVGIRTRPTQHVLVIQTVHAHANVWSKT